MGAPLSGLDTSPGTFVKAGTTTVPSYKWELNSGVPVAAASHGYPGYIQVYWDGKFEPDPDTGEVVPMLRKVGVGYPKGGLVKGVRQVGTLGPNDPGEIDCTDFVRYMATQGLFRVDTFLGPAWPDYSHSSASGARASFRAKAEYAKGLLDPQNLARLRKAHVELYPESRAFLEPAMGISREGGKLRPGTIAAEQMELLARRVMAQGDAWREAFRAAEQLDPESVDPSPEQMARVEAQAAQAALVAAEERRVAAEQAALHAANGALAQAAEASERASKAEAEAKRVQAEKAALEAKLAELDRLKADNAKLLKALAKADKQSAEAKPADETAQPKQSDAGALPPVEG
jgi:hypothetical protein